MIDLKIENMAQKRRESQPKEEPKAEPQPAAEPEPMKESGMVAVSLGEGFNQIFRDLTVDQVVEGGQTMNPSIEDIYEAIESTHAQNVYVLPNNTNIILAAQQAAELTERNVIVLPTKSVPMGISAALAFNPEEEVEENTRAMTEAAEHVHTASITYAVRDTNFDNREIHSGDIMGLLDNKLTYLGHDVREVALHMADEMVNEDAALVTVYYGSDVSEEDARQLTDEIAEKYTECDVAMQFGGQPLYYYLIAV